jgi:hypothetical protein
MVGLMGFHRRRIERAAMAQEIAVHGMRVIGSRDRADRELSPISYQLGVKCSFLGGEKSASQCQHEGDACDGKTCILFEGASMS